MRIDESRVFVFQFDTTDMGGVTFPIRATERAEAAVILKNCLSRIQTELAMEFPTVQPPFNSLNSSVAQQIDTNKISSSTAAAASGIPYDVLEMRIDTLLGDLGAKNLDAAAKAKTIQEWTSIEFKPENFTAIITDLELIASGQKEVSVKGKKK